MHSMLFSPAGEFPGYGYFPALASAGLVHGVFARQGGGSAAPYHSLNLSFAVGDDPVVVRANRDLLKSSLGIAAMVSARQVHGDRILNVAKVPQVDSEVDGYDALITTEKCGLLIQQADCQAVIIHDPVTPALALVHVGWRGSVLGILGATVRAMTADFGSTPSQLRAAISPALGPCCAEFNNYQRELPAWMHEFQVRPCYFDFPAISVKQLVDAGLDSDRISRADLCTCCNDDYFSYRRSPVTGRFATVAALLG